MSAVGLGLAIGLVIAFVLSGYIAELLWGVAATDARTWVGTVGLLALVGLLASYLPTRQASRLDPADTLRLE